MNCKDKKSIASQNLQIRWNIALETEKSRPCNNNCRDCPNKQPSRAINEISQEGK
ncbi:MAG: hypothetical protein ACI9V8_001951 [Urechidicola sp.]|jgi:hypothetical protein